MVRAALFLAPLVAAVHQANHGCLDASKFTTLVLDGSQGATMSNSNLGGAGGKAEWNPTGPPYMQIDNVGFVQKQPAMPDNNQPMSMRITATSPNYSPDDATLNGLQHGGNGKFIVVNLQGPKGGAAALSVGRHPVVTYVDLRIELLNGNTKAPLGVGPGFETYLTFYDFDGLTGRGFECVQMRAPGGGYVKGFTDTNTELSLAGQSELDQWIADDTAQGGNYDSTTRPQTWSGNMLWCATDHGINQDNPTNPMDLTTLQEERSLHMKIQDTNTFEVRFVVHTGNVQDGRNFLFAGRPHVLPCPSPPPSAPPPPPPVPIIVLPVIVAADPHFLAAHGDRYDFKGNDKTTYNLLSHAKLSVNAFFENVDYHEAGQKRRLVHGSYMRAVYTTFATRTGKQARIEYNAKFAKYVKYTVVDALGEELEENRVRLTTGFAREIDDCSLAFDGRALTIATPEWTIVSSNRVKPGIIGASTCAAGKCFLEISLTPRFDADHAQVAPHGLIGQSYDGDDLGVIGNTDSYSTRANETTTEAMGEGAIEGVAADYEMAAKWATDFKFSRFGKTHAPPRDVSALTGKKVKRVDVVAKTTD